MNASPEELSNPKRAESNIMSLINDIYANVAFHFGFNRQHKQGEPGCECRERGKYKFNENKCTSSIFVSLAVGSFNFCLGSIWAAEEVTERTIDACRSNHCHFDLAVTSKDK